MTSISCVKRVAAIAACLCLAIPAVCLSATEGTDSQAVNLSGRQIRVLILKDFIRFDPDYVEHRQRLGRWLDSLRGRLVASALPITPPRATPAAPTRFASRPCPPR